MYGRCTMNDESKRLDGVHDMVSREKMCEAARLRRDTYAITPGTPFIQREFGFYCLDRWANQGMPQDMESRAKDIHRGTVCAECGLCLLGRRGPLQCPWFYLSQVKKRYGSVPHMGSSRQKIFTPFTTRPSRR